MTLFLLALGLTAPSASAAPQGGAAASAELRSLREDVSEASAEEAVLLERLDDIDSRRRPLDAKVAALDGQIATLQHEVDAAEARLEAVQSEFVVAQSRLALSAGELATAKRTLAERAVAAYVGGGPATAAGLLLRSRSAQEVAATVSYLDSLVDRQQEAIRHYSRLRDATQELTGPIESKKDEAMAQRSVVVAKRTALEEGRAQQQVLRQEVLSEQYEQERLVGEVRSRKAEFEARIVALRADSESLAGLLQSIQAGQGPTPAGSGVLLPPIPGAVITSGFGPRVHPIFGSVRMHDGVDYRAAMGTPVRASGAGTVASAGPRGGYGNATVVDHGGSLATLVAHQSVIYVVAGQHVEAGQVIGAVGSTGFSTGPHLHFEVRVSGVPVNPLLYL